jgi:hypothetical protein
LYTVRPGRRLGWEIDDLADELSDLLGRAVDLVSRRALHPLLRRAVLADARQCSTKVQQPDRPCQSVNVMFEH